MRRFARSPHRVRRGALIAAASCAVLLAAGAPASADDKQACLAASEKAQQLRNAGKLTDAREQLALCGRAECPKLVQQDCTAWMSEVLQVLPNVIPAAKDRKGRDIVDVRVSIDGRVVAESLDGRPIMADPGVHTFRFETKGAAPIDQQVVVRQGEKNRILPLTFARNDDSDVATAGDAGAGAGTRAGGGGANGEGGKPGGERARSDEPTSGPPVLGFVLGAAGLVAGGAALYIGLAADADGRNLRDTCAPKCAQSDVDDVKSRQNLAAYIGIGAGVVFAAGLAIVVIHYTTSGSKSGKSLVVPSIVTADGSGAGTTIFRF